MKYLSIFEISLFIIMSIWIGYPTTILMASIIYMIFNLNKYSVISVINSICLNILGYKTMFICHTIMASYCFIHNYDKIKQYHDLMTCITSDVKNGTINKCINFLNIVTNYIKKLEDYLIEKMKYKSFGEKYLECREFYNKAAQMFMNSVYYILSEYGYTPNNPEIITDKKDIELLKDLDIEPNLNIQEKDTELYNNLEKLKNVMEQFKNMVKSTENKSINLQNFYNFPKSQKKVIKVKGKKKRFKRG